MSQVDPKGCGTRSRDVSRWKTCPLWRRQIILRRLSLLEVRPDWSLGLLVLLGVTPKAPRVLGHATTFILFFFFKSPCLYNVEGDSKFNPWEAERVVNFVQDVLKAGELDLGFLRRSQCGYPSPGQL